MYSSDSVHGGSLFCVYRDKIPVFRRKDNMKHYLEQAEAVLRDVASRDSG